MNGPEARERLFSRVCDGIATGEEIAALHALLGNDPAALDAWLLYSALHGELAGGTALEENAATARAGGPAEMPSPRFLRLQWRPLAAGLLFGLFAATMVWAYVAPPAAKVVALLEESFETSAAPPAARVALEPGVWRGDYAEVVGEEQGVKPASGRKMLRFLRASFDGKAKPTGGHIADVYRLIDLRPYRGEFADGRGVVEVSAGFNAIPFPGDEKYGCAISVYALEAGTVPDRAERLGSALTADSIAMARSNRAKLDRDPATWQRLTTELRLPPQTEFVVVRLHVSQMFDAAAKAAFTGFYADDVRVLLTRRSPLP